MGIEDIKPTFISCRKCGKKLIERQRNGVWHFLFGKGNGSDFIPVDMYIQGNVKIRCLRRTCGAWNVLNYFPPAFQSEEVPKRPELCKEKKTE